MKRILFFVNICLYINFSFVQAQEKEVFPTRDAEWTVCCNKSHWDYVSFSNYHVADYMVSMANRDTVCNQKTYHIFTERDLKGGFRVDNAKVWITFDWEHEYLLYDFDVNVGDTIFHGTIYKEYPSYGGTYYDYKPDFTCISIVDSVTEEREINRIYTSAYLIRPPSYPLYEEIYTSLSSDIWQEGLGSLRGCFMSWAGFGPYLTGGYDLYSYYTRSLKREGEIVYFDSTIPKYPDVPDIRGLNELETSALQVYYDESLRSLSVHSEDADWTGTFSLYDLSGNRLYQTSVCSRVQVPLDSYPDGYYLCEIVCGNRVVYSSKIRL